MLTICNGVVRISCNGYKSVMVLDIDKTGHVTGPVARETGCYVLFVPIESTSKNMGGNGAIMLSGRGRSG